MAVLCISSSVIIILGNEKSVQEVKKTKGRQRVLFNSSSEENKFYTKDLYSQGYSASRMMMMRAVLVAIHVLNKIHVLV